MGYYTSFSLEVDQNQEVIQKFREENDYASNAFDENGDTEESCKWYSHEEEIINFSKKHPNILFTLSGEGEESGDIWKMYVKNGVAQRAKAQVVIADVDMNLFPKAVTTKTKVQVTFTVELESNTLGTAQEICDNFSSEVAYLFPDTDDTKVTFSTLDECKVK